ncbi:hypothetical protein GCM10022403_074050 [Streptomyces coacervatus]|uniref:Uncharacterized protein n=1 Tax=Streptomyces coacervatus TaxID=647381 RepID=A0ABP7IYN9_9ACTN
MREWKSLSARSVFPHSMFRAKSGPNGSEIGVQARNAAVGRRGAAHGYRRTQGHNDAKLQANLFKYSDDTGDKYPLTSPPVPLQ